MAVLRPLKIVIENFSDGDEFEIDAPYDPEKPDGPSRKVPFSREIYVEREDFAEVPQKKWFRLAPGQEVRLRYACIIKCERAVKDAAGNITELRCTWDPQSKGGAPADGRKIKGTVHWVSAKHAVDAEVRLYDRLFGEKMAQLAPHEDGDGEPDYVSMLNPHSLEVLKGAKLEPSLAPSKPGDRVQFERMGYFCVDLDSKPGTPVWNRTISLKDSWAAIAKKA
jgi:glutaminyl-tRNA synthetase